MSTTMRTTLQTVPESLPADHVTNNTSTSTSTTQSETKPHTQHAPGSLKTRSSSAAAKVCLSFFLYSLFITQLIIMVKWRKFNCICRSPLIITYSVLFMTYYYN